MCRLARIAAINPMTRLSYDSFPKLTMDLFPSTLWSSVGVSDPSKVWIHVKIDGQDGWISGEEDFEAVGLPGAG